MSSIFWQAKVAGLEGRLEAIHGHRVALFREDARVKLLADALGLGERNGQRNKFYEADPAWRRARDRYRSAVASAERAWNVLHPQPHPGMTWGSERCRPS